MWGWAVAGWMTFAVVATVLHIRWRRTHPSCAPEVAAFMLRFETELARSHPKVDFLGLLPDRFACLLRVDGQETPVALHEAFRHSQAFPEAFAAMVARLLDDVRAVGLDRVDDVDFAAAAPMILPQIRSSSWLDAQGRFGESALVYRRLNDDLVAVYVLDDPHSMIFVCRAHLQRWRKTEDDLHNLAVANLARMAGGRLSAAAAARRPFVLQTGDGYDAARVFLLEEADDLLVAIPDRDTLWVGGAEGQDIEQLMATTTAISATAAHPVSPQVWRLSGGRLEPWSARS